MAKNTSTAKPFEAGETNARAVRNPDADAPQPRAGRRGAQTAENVAGQPATDNASASESDQPAAAGEKPPRTRAAKGATSTAGARKRTAGKHRQ